MQVSKFLKENILIQKSQSLYARLHCVFFQAPVVAKLLDNQGSAPFLRIWDGRQVIVSLAYMYWIFNIPTVILAYIQ